MKEFFYFFAYGSSMNPVTLITRVRSCVAVGMGRLAGHSLTFSRCTGHDGLKSAQANAIETGDVRDEIVGVVYRVALKDSHALDECEGVQNGYRSVTGKVEQEGKNVEARFYRTDDQSADDSLSPYDWYLALLSSGARIHGLPMTYQRQLRRIETIADSDKDRAARYFRLARKGESLIPFPRKALDR
jgi:gamma-glutamylcyclotransferase (GGCT)/AIG2-like uncharacterized protein YtfP